MVLVSDGLIAWGKEFEMAKGTLAEDLRKVATRVQTEQEQERLREQRRREREEERIRAEEERRYEQERDEEVEQLIRDLPAILKAAAEKGERSVELSYRPDESEFQDGLLNTLLNWPQPTFSGRAKRLVEFLERRGFRVEVGHGTECEVAVRGGGGDGDTYAEYNYRFLKVNF